MTDLHEPLWRDGDKRFVGICRVRAGGKDDDGKNTEGA
jgi:hypothetical protein